MLWDGFCCQRAPQGGPGAPPSLLSSSPQADGPSYVHGCPGTAFPPDSATGKPCGLGADTSPARPASPRGGTSRGCTGPTSLSFPRRLGGDTLGEAPGPPRGGCWQCLGRPQPQAAEMWRPQACLQSSFLQSRRCSSANVSDPLEADTGCGRTGEPARPAPGAAAQPGLGGREGGSRPVR